MSTLKFKLRPLKADDLSKGYTELLNYLSPAPPISGEIFQQFYEMVSSDHSSQRVLVVEDEEKQKLVGHLTVLVEKKMTRGGCWVAHIEDVVVDPNYRGQGLARFLVDAAIKEAKESRCYKTILNCSPELVGFYQKLGFRENGYELRIDHSCQK